MATVELFHEDAQDTPTLRRVDDKRGRRLQVGNDVVLEVEGELRSSAEVGKPILLRARVV